MEKLRLDLANRKEKTCCLTIRMKESVYDRVIELSNRYTILANKVINQCLEYALENLEEEVKNT